MRPLLYQTSVCEYEGNTEINDKELETLRESIENRLSNKSMTNAALGIYKVEKPDDVDGVVVKLNEFHEYAVKHKQTLSGYEYIQAYKYGVPFLDWLDSQNLSVNLSVNKRYMKEVLKKIIMIIPFMRVSCRISMTIVLLRRMDYR